MWWMWQKFRTKFSQKLFGDFSCKYLLDAEGWISGCYHEQPGKHITVDAKAEQVISPNFPVELWQCTDRKELGWYVYSKQCDEIWYAQVKETTAGKCETVKSIRISLPMLRDSGIVEQSQTRTTTKGYGKTLIALVNISQLTDHGIARPFPEGWT